MNPFFTKQIKKIKTLFKVVGIACMTYIGSATVLGNQIDFLEPAKFPSLISSVRINGPLNFCGEALPLKNPDVRERLEKEFLVALWDRPQIILWIKRCSRYMPHIEESLKKANMPDDLKYIAIIESALRSHAGSSKGAVGYWQFIRDTAKRYGLTVNSDIDERRNFFASTRAAIAYFKDLYDMFQSWTLAAAAYNMGEEGLMTAVLIQKTNNYYDLLLPLETQQYIFKAVAAKIILSNQKLYGFFIQNEDLYNVSDSDTVTVTCNQEIPIMLVSESAGTSFKTIKDLNPEFLGYYLTQGTYSFMVPKGKAVDFDSNFQKKYSEWVSSTEERIYLVKKGDSLTSIAERFNVPLPALMLWNRIGPSKHIYPGDKLIIYPNIDDP